MSKRNNKRSAESTINNPYAKALDNLKKNKTPPKKPTAEKPEAKINKTVRSKHNPGFTLTTADGTTIAFFKNTKNLQDPAYTRNIELALVDDPRMGVHLGIQKVLYQVCSDQPNVEQTYTYHNRNNQAIVYRQPLFIKYKNDTGIPDTTDEKRVWMEEKIVPVFNRYGNSKITGQAWNTTYMYQGDISGLETPTFLADYLTLQDTFDIMKMEYGTPPNGLTFNQLLLQRELWVSKSNRVKDTTLAAVQLLF